MWVPCAWGIHPCSITWWDFGGGYKGEIATSAQRWAVDLTDVHQAMFCFAQSTTQTWKLGSVKRKLEFPLLFFKLAQNSPGFINTCNMKELPLERARGGLCTALRRQRSLMSPCQTNSSCTEHAQLQGKSKTQGKDHLFWGCDHTMAHNPSTWWLTLLCGVCFPREGTSCLSNWLLIQWVTWLPQAAAPAL